MATFVVETYLSPDAAGEPDTTINRAVSAAAEVEASGRPVRYLRSIFVPDDELCLFLFEADAADVVRAVSERAGLDPERIALADSRER